jgi:transcriptional regulator with GAF, ATPase, and Fis domain
LEGAARLRFEGSPPLIAESAAMKPVLDLIQRTAPSDANVLITGENGTGKGLVAQAIHALSPRASRPMVTVNAGGVSETVFESELFGHVRGAFTDARADRVGRFELADGGTVPRRNRQRPRLAATAPSRDSPWNSSGWDPRTRKVDVALVGHQCQYRWSLGGRFRQDSGSLNTIDIPLPPLRDRREDIPALRCTFSTSTRRYRKSVTSFEPAAMDALLRHTWPVRELEHSIERVLMAGGPAITAGDLGFGTADSATSLDMPLEDVEAP